jgi:tetratricopeptide (TPR) repeat protein
VLRAEAARLAGLRLAAVQDRIAADLDAGAGSGLIAELEALTGRHAGHERLWQQLMTALYRAGRQADALAAYQRARQMLIEEAGLEPSPALATVHQQILAHDPRLLPEPAPATVAAETAAAETVPTAAAPPGRPAQLPRAASTFTGRAGELAQLDGLLAGAAEAGRPTTVVIAAVAGTAGVGKTALAVRWAHQVADQFPDGQLYVNLRGFDPGAPALAPAEAVRGFLDALGVPAERIPVSLDAQAALYRSTLAGKRILVVLDNARDAEQARPLLPGTPTAMVVVTSRNQLTPLVADGAHPLILATLSSVEAHELLAARLGPARVTAEPAAVGDIVTACARLPLALAIAAARAAIHPDFPLAALAAELTQARDRLDALTAGDPATDVRAVLSWSYQALSPAARRLFRLLGLHPGPDVSAPVAASLAGQPPPEARALLTELAQANLLTEHLPGRYGCHDLLRAYAADLSRDGDPDEQAAARSRLVEHYVHTVHAAHRLLHPADDPIPIPLDPPSPGTGPEQPADLEQAVGWLTTEHPAAVGTARVAAEAGLPTLAWQLAWVLDTFLSRQGHWPDVVAIWQAALHTADRLDPAARVHGHRALGTAFSRLRRFPEANVHYRRALDLDDPADHMGRAQTHHALAYLREQEDQLAEALDHAEQAYELFRAAGHERGQAYALNATGWYRALAGDYVRALADCQQAVVLNQQSGDQAGEAFAIDSVGYAQHRLGQHASAVDSFQRAIDLFHDIGERHGASISLTHLGESQHARGDTAAARAAWEQALAIVTDLDLPEAAELAAKLDEHRPVRLVS